MGFLTVCPGLLQRPVFPLYIPRGFLLGGSLIWTPGAFAARWTDLVCSDMCVVDASPPQVSEYLRRLFW